MKCEDATQTLVALQFGAIEGAERDEIEAHLCACTACVREFLAIKRAVELPDEPPAPSETSRARLRSAVAKELSRDRRVWRWWERPAAAALAAASVLFALRAVQVITTSEGRAPHGAIAR